MDIDFVRRGPLSSMDEKNRMKQGLCLVCGESWPSKSKLPKSRFNSDYSRNIRAIQTEKLTQTLRNWSHSPETIQTEVYPFLEASPVSETSIPLEINEEFSSVFSESQADILPSHRSFDCTINLSSSAEPSYGRIYQLTREEDKTIKDRNPIPLISEMLRTLSTGKIFTTLDLRGAYNLLRIKEGDEPKTAFITKYGQFEFLVMPFGLANAPAQFQRMMNSLFRHMIKIKYLGYIISPNGVSMDPSKISAVQDWPAPKKVRELQVFLGFTNFYRALVSGYSDITCHLTKLLKKDVPFSWGPEQETSFKRLKDAFAQPGFLAHPNDEQPFILETDASDFAISGVLHQHDQSNTLRPVAFYSRQMNNAERNYDIYDKELLAVVESFKHWRHLLQGGPSSSHCKLNGRADSLSRREDYFLDSDQSNFQRIIDPDNVLDLQVAMADLDLHVLVHSTVLDKVFVQEADWPLIIADFLAGEDNVWIEEISEDWLELCKKELKNFRFRDNTFVRILNDGKFTATYMPSNDRIQVMKHYHESLAHLKYGSIIDLITRRFWWPDMKKDLKDYISRCPECQLNRSASRTHAPLPIRPVPPVALPFERWGIDFYGPMMETKSGSKYLITCIDYATRWILAKPVREMTEAAVATFLYDLMMTYGAPFEIISDRGKSFLAEGISEFERENSIRHLATTPYHPQTNGMVERIHAMLGHGLTTLVADKRDRWDEYLPQVLLAIRTRTHAVTGYSPFYLLFGTHPRLPNDETPPRSSLMPLDEIERMEENSEFIARNLEEVGQARSAANVRTRPKLKQCENETDSTKIPRIIISKLAIW
ncbi:hypothetical protein BASA81_008182 [Batrachochytrium salamandrivorans]|nr:hypothetical protein BASA81_008182 [Batrachochytrium salamandrivorans]